MNEIKLPKARIEYRDPIVYIWFEKSIVIEANEMLEMFEAIKTVSNHKPCLLLNIVEAPIEASPEARKVAVDKKVAEGVIASASVVKMLGQRMIVNTFAEVSKPPYPVGVFTEEDKAIKWLLQHVQ